MSRKSYADPSFVDEFKDEPLTKFHVFLMVVSVVMPNMFMISQFSAMFDGLKNYNQVARRSLQGDMLIFMSFMAVSFWFIMDWQNFGLKLKIVTTAFPVGLFYAGAVCKALKYPWAPMLATLMFMPAGLCAVRYKFCHEVTRHKFYGALAGITFYTSVMVGMAWAYYIYLPPQHRWNQDSKNRLAAQVPEVYDYVYKERPLVYGVDCGPDKNTTMLNLLETDTKADIRAACAKAATLWFLCWMCPFVAIGCNMVIAIFCHLVGHIGKKGDISNMQRVLTKFVLLIAFCLTGMYASSTVLSASSLRMGSTLLAFFMAAFLILVVWIINEVDLSSLVHDADHNVLMQQLISISHSDWIKAMGVGACGVPFAYFLLLSYMNQSCRRQRGMEPGNDKFTPIGRRCINEVRSWNFTSICLKIIMLGELFFMLQVGVMKVTYIFLSFLNETLAPVDLHIVCILVFAIGCSMFLLPPVPGLPVYVFSGILLGEKGNQDPSIGFAGGILIATFLSLVTKLVACVGQYMIGYYAGKSLKVQQLIGVDQVPTRAIERVLKTRGFNLGKIALLVGGPDWPTSVTCGIIGVNIPQMLVGTLPVMSLTVPCILAGACMGRVIPGEESSWNLAATASTSTAAMVNMIAMVYAIFTVSKTIQKYGDELAKSRPEHKAVEDLTKREAYGVEILLRTREWGNLEKVYKIFLVVATAGMYFSNVIFVSLAESCFRPFALSSKIGDSYEESGLNGGVFSRDNSKGIVIWPIGHGALALFSGSLAMHVWFVKKMARRAKAQMKAEAYVSDVQHFSGGAVPAAGAGVDLVT